MFKLQQLSNLQQMLVAKKSMLGNFDIFNTCQKRQFHSHNLNQLIDKGSFMLTTNMDIYIPVVVLSVLGIVMVAGALIVGQFLRPKNPNKLKLQPYECGEDPLGSAWANFNVRFYVVALIFIIFDVEGALMFPVAAVFRKFNEVGAGGVVLLSILVFIAVLIQGIVYCWKKGDLDWAKSFNKGAYDKQSLNLAEKRER